MIEELPIHAHESIILKSIERNRVTILSAETGAGKSTCVPMMIMDSARPSRVRVIVSQPRRVAAIRLAERVQGQLDAMDDHRRLASTTSQTAHRVMPQRTKRVGYRIMNESDDSDCEIVYSTVGYLVNWLARNDKALEKVTHVILDEAHERSVDSDLLSLLLRRRMERSPEFQFKVVVMSATMDTDLYAQYFWGESFLEAMPRNKEEALLKARRDKDRAKSGRTPIAVGASRYPVRKVFLDSILTDERTKGFFNGVTEADDPAKLLFSSKDGDDPVLFTKGDLRKHILSRVTQFEMAVRVFLSDAAPKVGRGGKKQQLSPQILTPDYSLAVELCLFIGRIGLDGGAIGKLFPDDDERPSTEVLPEGECVLVFLPGEGEILTWIEVLEAKLRSLSATDRSRVECHVLHSQTTREKLDLAFIPAKPGRLKIVLSTNIAESSVTISDVTCVIDHGLRRALEYDSGLGMQQLRLGWVSKASCKQREGRAGRCRPGVFIALYTKQYHDAVFKLHDPPEIATLSLENTILKCKSLFPTEGVRSLLRDLIEPPDALQLNQAFTKLHRYGALTRPPVAEQRKFEDGLISADEMDSHMEVSFLGTIVPMFPCDINQTRLLLVGISCGLATECVIIAAAMSSADIFSMPTPFLIRNRALLNVQLASSFAGRVNMDGGLYSEPLAVYNVFCGWLNECRKDRDDWLQQRCVNHHRFRQFRTSISMFALRAAEVLMDLYSRQGTSFLLRRMATDMSKRLRKLAAIATSSKLTSESSEDQSVIDEADMIDRVVANELLAAPVEHLLSVILAGCVPNIINGIPKSGELFFAQAHDELKQLQRAFKDAAKGKKQAKALKAAEREKNKKVPSKDIETALIYLFQLTEELFGAGKVTSQVTSTQFATEYKRSLRLFNEIVSPLSSQISEQPEPVIDCDHYSYDPDIFKTPDEIFSIFDARRSIIIEFRPKTPPEARSAKQLRQSHAWASCARAMSLKKGNFAILEFHQTQQDVASLVQGMGRLNLDSTNTMPLPDTSKNEPIRTLAVVQITSTDSATKVTTQHVTQQDDVIPAVKFITTLTAGRPQSYWMPHHHYKDAVMNEEGIEVGSLNSPFSLLWIQGSISYPSRPYWRAPSIAGASSISILIENKVSSLPPDGESVKKEEFVEVARRQTNGRAVFAAAGSVMAFDASMSFTNATMFPSDSVEWNLRMLMLYDGVPSLYLTSADCASRIRHFHTTFPKINQKEFRQFHSILDSEKDILSGAVHSLGRKFLKQSDLAILNVGRAQLGALFYKGQGLMEGVMKDALICNISKLAAEIILRETNKSYVGSWTPMVLESKHQKGPLSLSSARLVRKESAGFIQTRRDLGGSSDQSTVLDYFEDQSSLSSTANSTTQQFRFPSKGAPSFTFEAEMPAASPQMKGPSESVGAFRFNVDLGSKGREDSVEAVANTLHEAQDATSSAPDFLPQFVWPEFQEPRYLTSSESDSIEYDSYYDDVYMKHI